MILDRNRVGLLWVLLAALSASPGRSEPPDPAAPSVSAAVTHRIERASRVRFLTRSGYVEAVGVRVGAEGFTSAELASWSADSRPGSGLLAWDEVLAVDVQGNQALRGAAGGAVTLGVVGLLIGFAGGVASPIGNVGLWSFEGAAIGVGSGALVGALIGAPQRRWARVYPAASAVGPAPETRSPAPESSAVATVRVLAIAPFADLTRRHKAGPVVAALREGIARQLQLHHDSLEVQVQALEDTDRLLAGAAPDAPDAPDAAGAARLPAAELRRLLGVDAVMMGAVTRSYRKGAVGTVFSVGLMNVNARGREVEMDLAIDAGPPGGVVWREHVRRSTPLFSSAAVLGDAVGAVVAAKVPYRRNTRLP